MGKEFKSIIIPDTILIVENGGKQGYIVPKGNENILATAMEWARHFEEGTGDTWEEKRKNGTWKEGTIHEYANGNFKLALKDAAGYSYNSGKLSFWDCTVTAPDGKTFVIGINSYILVELLKSCTLIKGTVQENVWLGREKANQGAYIESMSDFKQAQREKEEREKAKYKTTQYEVGDIVGTLTKRYVYCGTIYQHWDSWLTYCYEPHTWQNFYKLSATKLPQPKKVHLYVEYDAASKTMNRWSWSFEVRDRKASYVRFGEHTDINAETALKEFENLNSIGCYSLTQDTCMTLEELFEQYKKHTTSRVEM